MRLYVVRKWPLRREKSFCVLEYHTVSLCISCTVRKGPAYRQDHSCVVWTVYWNWVSVQAEIKWSPINRWGWRWTGSVQFCCKVRRNQRQLQPRSYRCRKQQCGGFCVSVWCLNAYNHGEHYETSCITKATHNAYVHPHTQFSCNECNNSEEWTINTDYLFTQYILQFLTHSKYE